MKKTLLLSLIIALIGMNAQLYAQTFVTGKIVDESGSSLPGATISIEGTNIATMADFEGKFRLEVQAGTHTLKFSFIGFLEEQAEVSISANEIKDVGTIILHSDAVMLDEMLVVASYARDRQTPVAFSTIEPEIIMEKLGTQEFPEILKSTPSIYATKQGGGYGDGRVNLRGFDSNNIGVLINGMPVNDMENGRVYWSNWAGLSDVTRTMQVQRGLGASRLAISSIGGTINIITRSTDVKKGGSVFYAIGNNGYTKTGFTVSTGLTENNWAVTASGSRTSGDGYVKGTDFEAWSYFLNISKRLSTKQQLSFTAFGAPQWHHQRSSQHLVQDFREHQDGIQFNSDYGYRNGSLYSGAYAYNQYHKPKISLAHNWDVNRNTQLNTTAYASFGKGGGRRITGPQARLLRFGFPYGEPYEETMLTTDGHLDFHGVMDINQASQIGSQAIVSMSVNSHDWYGILSSLNTQVGDIAITGGIDGRFYRGYHYTEIADLLGGEYYLDNSNINRPATTPLQAGDKISFFNYVDVLWEGLFLQGEYVHDNMSAFLSGAVSNTSYRRIDFFQYLPEEQISEWAHFLGYSVKAGFNYNLTSRHNVFVNGGYFTRAPFANAVFMNHTNIINEDAQPQRVLSTELGYGYRSNLMRADLTLYRTEWMDRTLTRSLGGQETANITGLDALHQGIEFEGTIYPMDKMDIKVMVSVGDWRWQDHVEAALFDENQQFVDSFQVFARGIHVGDAAQTTAAIGINYEILPKLKIGADYNYYDRLFAQYDIEGRTNRALIDVDAWQMPAYHLFDFNVRYAFKIGKLNSTLYGKINNLLDTEYIADGTDQTRVIGSEIQYGDASNSPVYFGFGRTWSVSLKINF